MAFSIIYITQVRRCGEGRDASSPQSSKSAEPDAGGRHHVCQVWFGGMRQLPTTRVGRLPKMILLRNFASWLLQRLVQSQADLRPSLASVVDENRHRYDVPTTSNRSGTDSILPITSSRSSVVRHRWSAVWVHIQAVSCGIGRTLLGSSVPFLLLASLYKTKRDMKYSIIYLFIYLFIYLSAPASGIQDLGI